MRSSTRSLVLALTMLVLTPSSALATAGFGDVPDGAWYEEPIAWLVENDMTTGIEPGCYAPDETVNRGQIAAFLFRLESVLGGSPTGSSHPFVDVVLDYQQIPISWMYEAGLTTGTSAATYSPDDPVTRGQFAAFLWRYAGRPDAASPHSFNDVTADWQDEAIAWMSESGTTTGTSLTTFSPDDSVTRAQAAAFIWRFVGRPDAGPLDHAACTRDLRLALIDAGLTTEEAACAIWYLVDYTVGELTDVLIGSAFPSPQMMVDISTAATECLTPDRIDELTQLLF